MKKETKEKVASISKIVLLTVGVAGFVAAAAVMGNAVQLLGQFGPLKRKKIQNYELTQTVKRLISRGLIIVKEKKGHKGLEVTDKGRKLLLKYELEGLQEAKPPKWDGKFRVIIFDIAERRRETRDELRKIIRGFGFVYIQQSVWVYPYPCEEIITLLKKYLDINTGMLYMIVDKIEDDGWLRDAFKLKK